jgi:hypothetical protein
MKIMGIVILFWFALLEFPLFSLDDAANIRITGDEKSAVIEHVRALAIPETAKAAIARFLEDVFVRDYVPPGIVVANREYEAICAAVVSRLFWSIFGNEDNPATGRGVFGDAWDMAQNVLYFGGAVFPWNKDAELRTGDILGIFYGPSIYNRPGRRYTHLALVIAVLPDRGALVAHWWQIPSGIQPVASSSPPWFFRLEFLADLLASYAELFTPVEIIRPKNTGKMETSGSIDGKKAGTYTFANRTWTY